MPDYSVEITRLEELINNASSSVRVGDMESRIDLKQARLRLEELKRLDTTGQYSRRPKMVPYSF